MLSRKKSIIFYNVLIFLVIFLQYGYCAQIAESPYDDPVKNTEIFLNGLKIKNFGVLLSLSNMGVRLAEIRKSLPNIDVPQKIATLKSKCLEDFNKSYKTVFEAHLQGNDIIYNFNTLYTIDQLKKISFGSTKNTVAVVGIPMLFEKYNPIWSIVEVSSNGSAKTVYIELSLENKGPIGIIKMVWNLSTESGRYYVNTGNEFDVSVATPIHKISKGWPMIPIN